MTCVTSLSMKAAARVSYLRAAATPTLRAIPAAGAWSHERFVGPIRAFARHRDPLAEASNWVALLIGSHLPFWPLYVWLSAGAQAMPSALLSAAMTPVFLLIPLLSRRSGLGGRIAMLLGGLANTVLTVWILGENSGTLLFLGPCAALAAVLFRWNERWLMLCFTLLPLAAWYGLREYPPVPLHRYDPAAARQIFELHAISVGILIAAFGWLQADIYRRMETTQEEADPRADEAGGMRAWLRA